MRVLKFKEEKKHEIIVTYGIVILFLCFMINCIK